LADARQRIGLYIDHYNLQRPHQGIEGLVPADRFFFAAPEVLQTLKERVAANARELAQHGVPKPPFYLTGQVEGQPFSIHRAGDRVVLQRGNQPAEDIDLVAAQPSSEVPTAPAREELPRPTCPDGSPLSLFQHTSRSWAPGTSPIDGLRRPTADSSPPQPPESAADQLEPPPDAAGGAS